MLRQQQRPKQATLSLKLLRLFNANSFLPSRGIGKTDAFSDTDSVIISQHLQSLTRSGMLDSRGGRSAASYRLTRLGEVARNFQEHELSQ